MFASIKQQHFLTTNSKNALQNANLAARQQATTTTATPAKPEEAALLKPGGKTLEELTGFSYPRCFF